MHEERLITRQKSTVLPYPVFGVHNKDAQSSEKRAARREEKWMMKAAYTKVPQHDTTRHECIRLGELAKRVSGHTHTHTLRQPAIYTRKVDRA